MRATRALRVSSLQLTRTCTTKGRGRATGATRRDPVVRPYASHDYVTPFEPDEAREVRWPE